MGLGHFSNPINKWFDLVGPIVAGGSGPAHCHPLIKAERTRYSGSNRTRRLSIRLKGRSIPRVINESGPEVVSR